MGPSEGGSPGRGGEEESSWTPALPLNLLFPGQWAAATGSGLCPSLPGPGPAGARPIWPPYVPPLSSQQPPGPPHTPATPSFIAVSCVSFRKHPGQAVYVCVCVFPWRPSGLNSMLPLQGAQVQFLVRELRSSRCR